MSSLQPASNFVQGFSSLRILNLDENCISDWSEVLKLSTLTRYLMYSMKQLMKVNVFFQFLQGSCCMSPVSFPGGPGSM